MNILDIAIAKQLAGGGGGSGTDNYNDLSNLPKINDTTLSGNKSSSALGLQSEINSDSKLASDLVDDTNQDNKFVTSTEKNTWNAKQNAIDADHKLNADYVDDSTSTNKFVTASDKETWNAKQNAIDADHKLSSSLVSFTTAEAAALASGIDSSKVGQISTNQTNILYAINTGVKNSLINTGKKKVPFTGITYTVNDDGSITVSGTNTGTDRTVYSLSDNKYVPNNHVGEKLSMHNLGSSNCYAIIFYSNNGTSWAHEQSLTNYEAITIADYPYYNICICVAQGFTVNPAQTFYPMICTFEIWNESHDYQPPALPNYDLTRLESEDRAALAEEIDAGAKNKLDYSAWKTVEITNGTGVWENNGVTLTATGADCYTVYNPSASTIPASMKIPVKQGDVLVMSWEYEIASGITAEALIFPNGNATGSVSGLIADKQLIYTVPSGVTYVTYRVGVRGTGNVAKFKNVMICTKAAFGVSQKFVPYRLPNNNLGYKTYEINLSAVTINKAGSGIYWYKISVSSDFNKVVSVSLTDGKEIPNKRSFMPYIENGTGGSQAIGFLIADPDAPTTMTFNNGAYMSLTAFGYLK